MNKFLKPFGDLLALGAICIGYAGYVRLPRMGSKFDVSINDVKKAFATLDLPPAVFGSQRLDLVVEASEPAKFTWSVRDNGVEMMRYVADLAPVSAAATRVTVSVSGPASGPNLQIGKNLEQNPTIRHLYIVAMEEQIAATLERRMVNYMAIYPATAAATAANLGAISSQMSAEGEAFRKRDRDNIAKAYANEAAAAKGQKP